MTDDESLRLIQQALLEVAPEHARGDKLTLDLPIQDLHIDSVLTLEMIGSIEDRLGRTFDEQDLAKVHTLRDIALLMRDGKIAVSK